MTFKKISVLCASLSCCALMLLGAGCGSGSTNPSETPKVTLKYWRVFDGNESFDEIFDAYKALHPQVSFEYKKLRTEEYEQELLKALAKGEGPDIFAIHNTNMGEYIDYLLPMPPTVTVGTIATEGSLRKETVIQNKTTTLPTINALTKDYVDVAPRDMIWSGKVYALPLSVDTLGLFYNKDMFNAAGIAQAPTTWEEFQADVIKLTKYVGDSLDIAQSGAALGTSQNVNRAVDIVQLLMLQNGTTMVGEKGEIAFNSIPQGTEDGVYPGLDAVRFYTQFADQGRESYAWNDSLPNSFDAFGAGKTAMYIGYSYDIPSLKAAAPKLRFGIAKIPQIAGSRQINFANYWLEGVSKSSKNSAYAWDFLAFAASKDHVGSYLAAARKPTALRSLIATQLDDAEVGPFAEQVLTATSWYRGNNTEKMESAFEGLIDDILRGTGRPTDALNRAAKIVGQTY
jgi:multiple sugar transport system substrate-binding protein